MKRNPNFAKLQAGYLFPEINRRKREYLAKNPDAKIISLGIGDTTEPLTEEVVNALNKSSTAMGTNEGYGGYVPEQGIPELRAKIAETIYNEIVDADEVFVSDGAKCDIGRLQIMFGPNVSVAVQDPSYPVYVDGSVIIGATGGYNSDKSQFNNIVYMECRKENNFFPDLNTLERTDLIYLCSPNNPTGAVATKEQLQALVEFAKKNKSIIIFDAAYAEFITDDLPRSIYEIEGAREVAIEVSSFSKPFGFTGVRLGWTVVPKELKFDDGTPVSNDWNRVMTTIFNGASRIIQVAALQALNDKGLGEMKDTVSYYMQNAKLIKQTLDELGYESIGGTNSPYIWADMKRDSWEMFSHILEECQVVTTPGSGFGPAGEGFVRFSAFGHKEDVEEAVERLKATLK